MTIFPVINLQTHHIHASLIRYVQSTPGAGPRVSLFPLLILSLSILCPLHLWTPNVPALFVYLTILLFSVCDIPAPSHAVRHTNGEADAGDEAVVSPRNGRLSAGPRREVVRSDEEDKQT
jgi:hypothetical protein